MKRIFIIDEYISSKQNGVGTYMKFLLSCLCTLDVEVNLLSFNSDGKYFEVKQNDKIRHFKFPICHGGAFLEIGGLCWPLFKMYIPDNIDNAFIISHSPCVDFLRQLRRQYKKSQLIFVIHDQGWTDSLLGNRIRLQEILSKTSQQKERHEIESYCKKFFIQERRMYSIADYVVCLSETTRELLCKTYNVPIKKIHLIPNGFSIAPNYNIPLSRVQTRKRLGVGEKERIILFVGRTTKAKGIEELLQAFEALYQCFDNLRLVIAGEVFRLNDFAKITPQSASCIVYTGLIDKERLNMWYRAADIGVLPSYTEQCSYTGMEMMASGLLIVTTDGNGLTDMFHHGKNALVTHVNSHLAKNLEKTLIKALNLEDDLRHSICSNAMDYVQTKYSISLMKEGYRKLLFESHYSTI